MPSAADIPNIVQAGVAVAGLLGGLLAFVWGRVEKIHRDQQHLIERCNVERTQDRLQGRERRATLLTIIELLLNVVRRHAPGAPEIGETREMLDDFRRRERIEAEQEERG